MPSKITMHRIVNTIDAAQTSGQTYSKPIRGKILSVKVEYTNSIPGNSSDRDTNLYDMNPSSSDVAKALQEILNIGTLGAAPDDDNNIYYPETNAQDNAGVNIDLSDTQGGDTAKFVPFIVFNRLLLRVTAADAGDITTVHLMVEEY